MEEAPPSIADLILSLQQATFMAKQLPLSSSTVHLHQIHSSLHTAHRHLSAFLSALPPPPTAEPSVSSAAAEADGDPMQVENGDHDVADDDGEETTSKCTIDKVEEKMRNCFIKNKRPKRPLSPSSAAFPEERRVSDDGVVERGGWDYDHYDVKLRALDLVYQFHC